MGAGKGPDTPGCTHAESNSMMMKVCHHLCQVLMVFLFNSLPSCDSSPSIPDDNPVLALTQVIHALAKTNKSNCDLSSMYMKVCKPDTFNDSDPQKLHAFPVQCELNFQDCPKAFQTDFPKVIFAVLPQGHYSGMVQARPPQLTPPFVLFG